jgi:hypothetical protein
MEVASRFTAYGRHQPPHAELLREAEPRSTHCRKSKAFFHRLVRGNERSGDGSPWFLCDCSASPPEFRPADGATAPPLPWWERAGVRGRRNRMSCDDCALPLIMAGLVPAIHEFLQARKTWMPGTRPGMTEGDTTQDSRLPRMRHPDDQAELVDPDQAPGGL